MKGTSKKKRSYSMDLSHFQRIKKEDLPDFQKFIPLELETLFDRSECIALACRPNNYTVGVVILLMEKEEITLEWIYVDGLFRRMGVGRALMDVVEKQARKKKISTITTGVYFLKNQQLEVTSLFFQSVGFLPPEKVGEFGIMSVTDLLACGLAQKKPNPETRDCIYPFYELSENALKDYAKLQKSIPSYAALRQTKGQIDNDCSLVYVQNDEVLATLIVTTEEDRLHVSSIYSKKNNTAALLQLFYVLMEILQENRTQTQQRELTYFAGTENMREHVRKCFPDVEIRRLAAMKQNYVASPITRVDLV